jgi:hypothetical protein
MGSSSLSLRRETALDLSLKGSVGSFNVGSGREGQNSIEVKYFLTHVGLDFSSGTNEKVLSHIAPVREIFKFENLEFDEIMQRDLDDARVSSELIPYLLDEQSSDLVKLFPPIIVVVLPVKEKENAPADLYPSVETLKDDIDGERHHIVRSGAVGQEAFQFQQPLLDGEPVDHDLVRLRLNTHRTRLVIVDGQHRAMALLALYRNLKDEWSDESRAPYKDYYAEWTPSYIQKFDLDEINLPVMLCTFPQLSEGYEGDFDLKQAARLVFLTLNKNARKVSDSRNRLLDDTDLIAELLRRGLSEIKDKDNRSDYSLRIHNVELDQVQDKVKLHDPIAITGVNHLYYIVEHLMLNDDDVNGIKQRRGRFSARKDLTAYGLMRRLNGRELIGDSAADATDREYYSNSAAEKLGDSFDEEYGTYIVSLLERFSPYERHNIAVLDMEKRLRQLNNRKVMPILFEGQGIGRVFQRHRENLKKKLDDEGFGGQSPEIRSTLKSLDDTKAQIDAALEKFRYERAGYFLEDLHDKYKIRDDSGEWVSFAVKKINKMYSNIFTTVAFQAALVCGFFGELERARSKYRQAGVEGAAPDKEAAFDLYLDQMNGFFTPQSFAEFKSLLKVFFGNPKKSDSDWQLLPTNQTFREVVQHGAMKPDKWPNYKFLVLEIWEPENKFLHSSVEENKLKGRKQVFRKLYKSNKREYCRENMKLEEDLTGEDKENIFKESKESICGFLKNVGSEIPSSEEFGDMLKDDFPTLLS